MNIELEARALEAIQALVRQAEVSRNLCDEAGMDYPAPLRRILGIDSVNGNAGGLGQPIIGPPPYHVRPPGAPGDWLAVPVDSMSAQTGVLAVLRHKGRPVPVKSVIAEFARLGIEANPGSIANVGTRLVANGVINRSKEDGWSLVDPSTAPILAGQHVWGQSELFTKQELAARRREAIRYLLQRFVDGLQNLQILNRLKELDWLRTPLNKDLVKADMEEMQQAGLIRRLGNSKKWALVENSL